jgi:ABC-type branched-chain amino acid transport systems, ATPase component
MIMALLSIDNLCAGYGPIRVLHDLSLHVDEGEIVTLIGANGAGKSTALRAVSRLIPIISGAIVYKNENISTIPSHAIARRGIAHVPEGRGIFGNLSVLENLKLSFYANRSGPAASKLLAGVFDMFPVLGERKRQLASTLSGGEQQMLAIGRALIADGDLFIFDEPSMGLSPVFVKNVFSIIADIHKKGKTILLVEQNATMALNFSNRAYVLENGRIIAQGPSASIAGNTELKRAYLG